MEIYRISTRVMVLLLAGALLLFGATSSTAVDLNKSLGGATSAMKPDIGGATSAMKPDIGGMLTQKLGVNAPGADGLMEKDKTITGEVTDPTKLASYGMDTKAGDKVGLTNLGGGSLGVKSLMGGDMMKLDMKDVFGEGAKLLMK